MWMSSNGKYFELLSELGMPVLNRPGMQLRKKSPGQGDSMALQCAGAFLAIVISHGSRVFEKAAEKRLYNQRKVSGIRAAIFSK